MAGKCEHSHTPKNVPFAKDEKLCDELELVRWDGLCLYELVFVSAHGSQRKRLHVSYSGCIFMERKNLLEIVHDL